MNAIHPQTKPGMVCLAVPRLDASCDFYQKLLGFNLLERGDGYAVLGAAETPLLRLEEQPNGLRQPYAPGLYHFAILLPERKHLAQIIHHLRQLRLPLHGYADHGVSEAVYFADPDGNGIEIYRDLPRTDWRRDDAGNLAMTTQPLDLDSLYAELNDPPAAWEALPAGAVIGHIHLQVSHLTQTERFYTDILGFDLVQRYGPSASFVSAGGYHHHIGLNTWVSAGSPPAAPNAVGLRWFELRLPDAAALAEVLNHLRTEGILPAEKASGWLVRDPSGNNVLLTATGGG